MLESYEAYRDADYLMGFAERLVKAAVINSVGEEKLNSAAAK